ncbi:MAG TPA: hypothetical protein VLB69_00110, partial [Rudaea sp.]|nr:hypothetical protein [Rudaea sp.]
LVLAAGWLLRQRVAGPPAATPPSPTLIVLPLRVVGAEHDESVLGDGLSEELITRLSGVDGLRLISRTSAALARNANLDLAQLAAKLGVTHALEGSLQQSDQQLRIELRLLDVATGRTLWAQSYDRAPNNVLRLESEIAQEVAQALALRFGLRHTNDATIDPRLYQRYLLARRDAGRGYRAQAIEQLQAIVREAPAFAPAHATLARLLVSNLRGTEPDAAEIEEGRREAQQALALDPNLAETQAALAVLSCRAAQWARCVELFKHALGLDPSDSDARTSYAYWLSGMGYLDEALSEAETAWRYDPLNGLDDFVRGRLLDTLGRHDEAWQFLEGLPNPYPQWFNAVWRHDYAKARELIDRMPEEQHFRESYIAVTAALQDPTLWPQALAAIEDSERRGGRVNFDRLLMPDPDYAIMIPALEKMLREGWPSYYLLMWMPEQARLRADPRFSDMLQRTGIVDYWNSRGWPPQCRRDGARAVCP